MKALETLIAWGDEMLKQHPNKILSFAEAIDKAQELLEMEKQQIIDAYNNGDLRSADLYYDETYGSKGSDENFKQFSLYEHKETIAISDTPTSSQTEISDEEIEKCNYTFFKDGIYFIADEISFKEGAKWYREQLKKKQCI